MTLFIDYSQKNQKRPEEIMNDFIIMEEVKKVFQTFINEILSDTGDLIHSIYIIGSSLTADFNPGQSDINSIFVVNRADLTFIKKLAPLGKKYGKKKIAAPLIMTPEYIKNSLDVFPIEFLNIKLLHYCLHGDDLFNNIEINASDLRHQCERELKVKLLGLQQGYITAAGDTAVLRDKFFHSFSGYIPLFKGILFLLGNNPPVHNEAVLSEIEKASGLNMEVFRFVMKSKKERTKLGDDKLNSIFDQYHEAIKKMGDIVNEIKN
jgi:hypothetical protein